MYLLWRTNEINKVHRTVKNKNYIKDPSPTYPTDSITGTHAKPQAKVVL